MTLDQRARAAARAVRDEVTTIDVPDHGAVVRRAGRRRRLTAALAGVAVVAAAGLGWAALVSDDPSTTPLAVGDDGTPGWTRVLKADAGLEGSSLYAVASDGDTALAGGSVLGADDWWATALWWTEDGASWQRAEHPPLSGQVLSIALHDGAALAFGTEGDRDEPDRASFAWRSEDGGRTWVDLALPADALGPPAPEMGRPFAGALAYFDGWWVAGGGSSTGYAGIWVSRTGDEWEQVLESRHAGGISLVGLDDGRLLAYGGTVGWVTDDPTEWGPHHDIEAPDGMYTQAIARGAALAVGREHVDGDTHLLRSDDAGRTWRVDESFPEAFPGVDLSGVEAFDGVTVLAGFDAEGSPGAWVSVDGGSWQEIPEALRRPAGGMLSLVTEVDDRIVVLGGAPELNRFYVFGPPDGGQAAPVEDVADAVVDDPDLEWLATEASGFGVTDFDPSLATVGEARLGDIEQYLPDAIRMNVGTLDPQDFGVATVEDIPVRVGVYQGGAGAFETPGGRGGPAPGVPSGSVPPSQDTLLVIDHQASGAKSTSVLDGASIAGLVDQLEGPGD